MNQVHRIILVWLLLPAVCLFSKDTESAYRTWMSVTGSNIEAELINRTKGNSVTLKKRDGSILFVDFNHLSFEDRKYLEKLAVLEGRPERILFIGNSYTGGIRNMLTGLIGASPYAHCQLSFIHPGGKTLTFHLENTRTMEEIRNGNWDAVVLQDQSQTPAIFPDKFLEAALGIDCVIDASGADTVFYETWGRRDGDKQNPHRFPTYEKMQDALSDSYAKAARKCDAIIAPVGRAWAILRKEHPELGEKLYANDGSHPAAPGAYLAACVFYATFFDAAPSASDFDGGLPEEQLNAIHAAALQAVRETSRK